MGESKNGLNKTGFVLARTVRSRVSVVHLKIKEPRQMLTRSKAQSLSKKERGDCKEKEKKPEQKARQ